LSWRYVKYSSLISLLFISLLTPFYSSTAEGTLTHILTVSEDLSFTLNDQSIAELADVVVPPSMKQKVFDYLKLSIEERDVQILEKYKTRYGANLIRIESLQEALLKKGLAYLYIMHPIDDVLYQRWQTAETQAREARLGLWSFSYFDPIPTHVMEKSSDKSQHGFLFATGIITATKYSQGRYYFYFNQDHSSDATIMIDKKHWPELTPDAANTWIGKTVLVRGWVEHYQGPYMQIYHPSHFSVLK
jgi:hypothetical protein